MVRLLKLSGRRFIVAVSLAETLERIRTCCFGVDAER
jgi:uncharacterized protein YlzI (FlbEa/FlbD family)